MMLTDISTSDIIAIGALGLSAYATWKTFKFNEKQNALNESQKKLNALLLEKEAEEMQSSKKADLGATFIKLGSNKYRLKIWNKGRSAARNVSLQFPEGNDCLIPSDIDSKFPLEVLEPQQGVELIAAVSLGTRSKHPIKLIWIDEFSDSNEKVVYPTL